MTPFFVLNTAVAGGSGLTPGPVTSAGMRRLRVLIAEDDPTNRMVTTRMLQRMGHTVETAPDGAEAVRRVLSETCDLVLMDMQMPVMDGLTAIKRIRHLQAERGEAPTPICTLTAHAMPEHEAAAFSAGAQAHGDGERVAQPLGHQVGEPGEALALLALAQ